MSAVIGETEVEVPRQRIYISGPMTGYMDLNSAAFVAAAERLRQQGWEPVNPADVVVEEQTWESFLKADLALLLGCYGVATLPGWQESRGAVLEVHVAQQVGLFVRPLDRWLV